MLSVFLISLLCSCILIYICTIIYKYKNYWSKRNIVQMDKDAWHFIFGECSLSEVYKKLYDNYPSQNYVGTFIGTKPALVLRNLEDIQAVLQGNFQSFYARGYKTSPTDVLTDNLLLIDDYRRWKLIRLKISPVFTALKLKHMFRTIERCASDFAEYLETNKQGKRDMFEALHIYTIASISASIFGINEGTRNTMESPILDKGLHKISSTFSFNIKFALSNICPRLYYHFNLKVFSEHENYFVGILKQIMNFRQNSMKNKNHDFIDTCLDLKSQGTVYDLSNDYEIPVSDEILAAQAFSFIIAGVDTGANALNFTLLELSNNQNILKRLHNEIDSLFEKCNDKITFEELKNMKYLDMVLNESMRKFPPIGLMQRMCTKDTVLPSERLKIEKGTLVIVPVFAIHRDDKYFPNPELFDPERFAPDNMSKIVKLSYLPFGEGNRICLGTKFAQLQVKICLAVLLRRYTLRGCNYSPQSFGPSFFGLRDSKARFELIPRNI